MLWLYLCVTVCTFSCCRSIILREGRWPIKVSGFLWANGILWLAQEGVRDWYIDIWQWQFHFHKKRTRTYCKYKSQTCHVIATSFHTPTSLIFPSEFELGSLSWIQDAKGFGFKEPYSLQCKRAMSLFLLTFAFARTIGFASSFFTFITSRVRVNCLLGSDKFLN